MLKCLATRCSFFLSFAASLSALATPSECEFKLALQLKVPSNGRFILSAAEGSSFKAKALNAVMATLGHGLTRSEAMEEITRETVARIAGGEETYSALTGAMGLSSFYSEEDLKKIPATGPLVAMANHPLSGTDGILIARLLKKVRPDVKVLMTKQLKNVEFLKNEAFFIDLEKPELRTLADMMRWVSDGHALVIFPAGEVSNRDGFDAKTSTDGAWMNGAAGIAAKTKASVLPLYVAATPSRTINFIRKLPKHPGANASRLQKFLGGVRSTLFSMWYTHEVLSHRDRNVSIAVGDIVSAKELEFFQDENKKYDISRMTLFLRAKTLQLSSNPKSVIDPATLRAEAPLREPVEESLIQSEIQQLENQGDARLLESGEYRVYVAKAARIPNILQELGRLRELTFRTVGEGTGLPSDLDSFDQHYHHLVLWDKQANRIAGAYRLGVAKEILAEHGPAGIYTTTLFNFNRLLTHELSNGLELGRSFVVPDYQRKPKPLFLLLKGIAAFLAKNPSIKDLFGPVSISNSYSDTSKRLLFTYIRHHMFMNEFAGDVAPKNPPPELGPLTSLEMEMLSGAASNLKDVSKMVSLLEPDHKSLPVLYLKYTELGAGFLGFHFDPSFNSYDGLIWTDVSQLSLDKLSKFMEADDAQKYLRFHRKL